MDLKEIIRLCAFIAIVYWTPRFLIDLAPEHKGIINLGVLSVAFSLFYVLPICYGLRHKQKPSGDELAAEGILKDIQKLASEEKQTKK